MNCCRHNTLKSTAIAIVDNTLRITIPETTLSEGCYTIIVEQDILDTMVGLPVVIVNGAEIIPLWTCGNAKAVFAIQLLQSGLQKRCGCDCDLFIPVDYVNTGIESNPTHFTVTRRLQSICEVR